MDRLTPGVSYVPAQDVLVISLVTEDMRLEGAWHVGWPANRQPTEPYVRFMVHRDGYLLAVMVYEASRWVPSAVVKGSADRELLCMWAADEEDCLWVPLFPDAWDVSRTMTLIELPKNGPSVTLGTARSGRLVGLLVHKASKSLEPGILPPAGKA